MSFVLMILLSLVCTQDAYPDVFDLSTGQTLGLAAASFAVVTLNALWISRRTIRALHVAPYRRDSILERCDRRWARHLLLLCGVYALLLFAGGWGNLIRSEWKQGVFPAPGSEVLLLLPFLAGYVVSWVLFYDADREAHRSADRLIVADAFGQARLEAHPPTTAVPFHHRWAYVLFQLRQKFIVFAPLVPIVLYIEIERLLRRVGVPKDVVVVVGGCLFAAMVLGAPLLFRLAIGLTSMPASPLRERLEASMRRLGFRCRDLLVWNTRGGMANAMVVGFVPLMRYVIFTDRILETFEEEELLAVLGHEVGHMRHRHLPFYLLFLLLSMTALGMASEAYFLPALSQGLSALVDAFPTLLDPDLPKWFGPSGFLAPVPTAILLLLYVFVVFGGIMRQCERQADVYGCRSVSCGDPNCRGHEGRTASGEVLCPTGIGVFIGALEKVCRVNGISRDNPGFFQSWQHGSIAGRVAFLEEIRRRPAAEELFQRRLLRVKLAGVAALVAALWWLSV